MEKVVKESLDNQSHSLFNIAIEEINKNIDKTIFNISTYSKENNTIILETEYTFENETFNIRGFHHFTKIVLDFNTLDINFSSKITNERLYELEDFIYTDEYSFDMDETDVINDSNFSLSNLEHIYNEYLIIILVDKNDFEEELKEYLENVDNNEF